MELNTEILNAICTSLERKIKKTRGLKAYFPQKQRNGHSFEQWLQVELCGLLPGEITDEITIEKYFKEHNKAIDIYCNSFAIELSVSLKGPKATKSKLKNDRKRLEKCATKQNKWLIVLAFLNNIPVETWIQHLENEIIIRSNQKEFKIEGVPSKACFFFGHPKH